MRPHFERDQIKMGPVGLSVFHVVVLIVNAFGTKRVFLVLCFLSSRASLVVRVLRQKIDNGVKAVYLLSIVIHPVQRVEVLLDDVPVGAPHLADQDDNCNDYEEKDARQGSKPDDHIQEGVLLTI